jgi:hypothetical protein
MGLIAFGSDENDRQVSRSTRGACRALATTERLANLAHCARLQQADSVNAVMSSAR